MPGAVALGATYLGNDRCRFLVWAPRAQQVEVRLIGPEDRLIPLQPEERGYHQAPADGVRPGSRYVYRLDGAIERPDPVSRYPLPAGIWSKLLDSGTERWYGAGSTLPPTILSEGEVSLTLPPQAVVLFVAAK
ncbi:MAG: hypothetical protein WCD80_14085 [Desulfobaccales bacterium]